MTRSFKIPRVLNDKVISNNILEENALVILVILIRLH
ncbi:hypothetical protein LEMLEM_LOCUS6732 [Lemmus lemmus]